MTINYTPEEINEILNDYFTGITTRQYVGARYVPIFGRRDEDSIIWDNTGTYEPLTIVLYQGNSYTSRQYVPIGVEIDNEDYWALTGNYNAQVEAYRREVATLSDQVDELDSRVGQQAVCFENVADMTASEDLQSGMFAHTNGFHTSGDGGAAYYEIVDDATANGMDVILLDNGVFATLVITSNSVTPEQFGAYGDGVHDDSNAINQALQSSNNVIFNTKTYKCNTTLLVNRYKQTVNGNGCIITTDNTQSFSQLKLDGTLSPAYRTLIVVKNMIIKGNESSTDLNNVEIYKAANFSFINCRFETSNNNLFIDSGLIFKFDNCDFTKSDLVIKTPDTFSYSPINNSAFYSCRFYDVNQIINNTGACIGHGISFYSCEIEYIHSTESAAIVLNATNRSSYNILNFYDCWIEDITPVFLYFVSTSSVYDKVLLSGCTTRTPSNTATNFIISDYGIVVEIGGTDPTAYSDSRIKILNYNGDNQVLSIHTDQSWSPAANYLADGFTTVNHNGINKIAKTQSMTFSGKGTAKTFQIINQSEQLRFIPSDASNGFGFNCTYDRPFCLYGGGSFIYLWTYGNHLYVKSATVPSSGNDGTQII